MWSRSFWIDVADRAARTAAQIAAALLSLDGVNLLTLDWLQFGDAVALSAVLSVLTSIAATRVGDPGTASLVTTGRHTRG